MPVKEPPPLVTDQVPVVVPPLTLAPLRANADGVADWQTVLGPPAFTTAAAFTVIVAEPDWVVEQPRPLV